MVPEYKVALVTFFVSFAAFYGIDKALFQSNDNMCMVSPSPPTCPPPSPPCAVCARCDCPTELQCPPRKLRAFWKNYTIPPDFVVEVQPPSWYGKLPLPSDPANMSYGQPADMKWDPDMISPEAEHLYKRYFFNKKFGTFLEVGALDGRIGANTRWFEEHLGWRGILIEASQKYLELVQNRPLGLSYRAAIADSFRKVHYVWGAVTGNAAAVQGIVEFMDDKFLERFHQGMKREQMDNLPNIKVIPAVPVGYIIDDAGFTHINFFSLDVEGAEYTVLENFDWDRIKVDVWCIEENWNRDIVTKLMLKKGYIADPDHPIPYNMWFHHKDFTPYTCTDAGGREDCAYTKFGRG